MILHVGPKAKLAYRIVVENKLKKIRGIFILTLIGLPIVVFQSFKMEWVSSNAAAGDGILSSVGMVFSGDGTGSAFLISTTKLITARHVVADLEIGDIVEVDFVKAKLLETRVEAKVLFISRSEARYDDYALLELLAPINLSPIELASATDSKMGDEVAVIGYPFGSFSSTKGTISNDAAFGNESVLQLYAGAWPGNSGGPIIDTRTSEAIGILMAGLEDEGKGMTFAVKIDQLINDPLLEEMKIDLLK